MKAAHLLVLAGAVFLSWDIAAQELLVPSAELLPTVLPTSFKIPLEYIPFAMAGLRGIGEALGWVAAKTENQWDNKIAYGFSKLLNFLGWGIGQFGIGVPKRAHHPKASDSSAE